jgi:hypothetical protein
MLADDLRDFLKQEPFRPFRVTLSDGRTFDVHHSECMLLGFAIAELVFPAYDRHVTIALSHVMLIEYLEDAES